MTQQQQQQKQQQSDDTSNTVTSGTTGGIAWSGSLMGSQNPHVPTHGYRYSTTSKRYKYINDGINNNNNSNKDHEYDDEELPNYIQIRFQNRQGIEVMDESYDVPISSTTQDLQLLLHELIKNKATSTSSSKDDSNTKMTPYAFYIQLENDEKERNKNNDTANEVEVSTSIRDVLLEQQQQQQQLDTKETKKKKISTESIVYITYTPLSIYRVRPVTRCTNTLLGHTNAILHVSFAPNGTLLASGGGDTMIRFWNTSTTGMVKYVCAGHVDHILCTQWSTDSQRFVSGDKRGCIIVWDPHTGTPIHSSSSSTSPASTSTNGTSTKTITAKPIKAHSKYISSLAWEPLHLCTTDSTSSDTTSSTTTTSNNNSNNNNNTKKKTSVDLVVCERLATGSGDTTIKIWNVRTNTLLYTLSGHTDNVECVKWTGEQMIVSASRDRTIKIWNPNRGILIRTLTGHGHRINTIAISCDYLLRCGPYDYFNNKTFTNKNEMIQVAKDKYSAYRNEHGPDTLVSGSDDFTIYMWRYETEKQPIKRLIGHQQLINHIQYSPDARYIASASFDKKIKLWNGRTGEFLYTLTGHVGPVYQIVWSYDSRYLVSASKDSTAKLWDISAINSSSTSKVIKTSAKETLPGHADEVYALDWCPITGAVATGSKDRTIKIWKH